MNSFTRSVTNWDLKPKYCFVDNQALKLYAHELAEKDLIVPSWREEVYSQDDGDQLIEFLGIADSINFCFTDFKTGNKFDVEHPKGKIWKGCYAMAASLKRALDEGIPILRPYFLSSIDEDVAGYIFRHITTPIPMLAARVANLRNVGEVFLKSKVGSFSNLFREADFRAFNDGKGIVEGLVQLFDCYKDDFIWSNEREVRLLRFSKRAQLLPLEYYGRAKSSDGRLEPLKDPENIGPIADYQVPKTLRSMHIIYYHPDLENIVDTGQVLNAGSRAETEIRIQTIRVMCELLWLINEFRIMKFNKPRITMAELDYVVWLAGRADKSNHHYTLTTAY